MMLPIESIVTGSTVWRTSAHVNDGRNGWPFAVFTPTSTAIVYVLCSSSGIIGTTVTASTIAGFAQSDASNRSVVPVTSWTGTGIAEPGSFGVVPFMRSYITTLPASVVM